MKNFLILIIVLVCAGYTSHAKNKPQFKYGFGGGINFSNIVVNESYALFEDISGETYSSKYSTIFSNVGSQFFFHGEFAFDHIVLALKPGIATYNFGKTDEIVFNAETVEQHSDYLLRYIGLPIEGKWFLGDAKLKPYLGGEVTASYLLRQGGDANYSFISPRFSGGPIIGTYLSFDNFDIVTTLGYDLGFHIINNKDNRYNTSGETPFSQSDIILNNLHFSISIIFSYAESNLKKSLDCIKIKKRR